MRSATPPVSTIGSYGSRSFGGGNEQGWSQFGDNNAGKSEFPTSADSFTMPAFLAGRVSRSKDFDEGPPSSSWSSDIFGNPTGDLASSSSSSSASRPPQSSAIFSHLPDSSSQSTRDHDENLDKIVGSMLDQLLITDDREHFSGTDSQQHQRHTGGGTSSGSLAQQPASSSSSLLSSFPQTSTSHLSSNNGSRSSSPMSQPSLASVFGTSPGFGAPFGMSSLGSSTSTSLSTSAALSQGRSQSQQSFRDRDAHGNMGKMIGTSSQIVGSPTALHLESSPDTVMSLSSTSMLSPSARSSLRAQSPPFVPTMRSASAASKHNHHHSSSSAAPSSSSSSSSSFTFAQQNTNIAASPSYATHSSFVQSSPSSLASSPSPGHNGFDTSTSSTPSSSSRAPSQQHHYILHHHHHHHQQQQQQQQPQQHQHQHRHQHQHQYQQQQRRQFSPTPAVNGYTDNYNHQHQQHQQNPNGHPHSAEFPPSSVKNGYSLPPSAKSMSISSTAPAGSASYGAHSTSRQPQAQQQYYPTSQSTSIQHQHQQHRALSSTHPSLHQQQYQQQQSHHHQQQRRSSSNSRQGQHPSQNQHQIVLGPSTTASSSSSSYPVSTSPSPTIITSQGYHHSTASGPLSHSHGHNAQPRSQHPQHQIHGLSHTHPHPAQYQVSHPHSHAHSHSHSHSHSYPRSKSTLTIPNHINHHAHSHPRPHSAQNMLSPQTSPSLGSLSATPSPNLIPTSKEFIEDDPLMYGYLRHTGANLRNGGITSGSHSRSATPTSQPGSRSASPLGHYPRPSSKNKMHQAPSPLAAIGASGLSASSSILLFSALSNDIIWFAQQCILDAKSRAIVRAQLAGRTQSVIQSVWSYARVELTGSIIQSLALPSSDVDLIVTSDESGVNLSGYELIKKLGGRKKAMAKFQSRKLRTFAYALGGDDVKAKEAAAALAKEKMIAGNLANNGDKTSNSNKNEKTSPADGAAVTADVSNGVTSSTTETENRTEVEAKEKAPTRPLSRNQKRKNKRKKEVKLIRLHCSLTGIPTDMWFDTENQPELALANARKQHMLSFIHRYSPLQTLSFVIKAYIREKELNTGYCGLGSYGVVLMIVRYLQHLSTHANLKDYSLGQLLLGFFQTYAQLDYTKYGVDVSNGGSFFLKPQVERLCSKHAAMAAGKAPSSVSSLSGAQAQAGSSSSGSSEAIISTETPEKKVMDDAAVAVTDNDDENIIQVVSKAGNRRGSSRHRNRHRGNARCRFQVRHFHCQRIFQCEACGEQHFHKDHVLEIRDPANKDNIVTCGGEFLQNITQSFIKACGSMFQLPYYRKSHGVSQDRTSSIAARVLPSELILNPEGLQEKDKETRQSCSEVASNSNKQQEEQGDNGNDEEEEEKKNPSSSTLESALSLLERQLSKQSTEEVDADFERDQSDQGSFLDAPKMIADDVPSSTPTPVTSPNVPLRTLSVEKVETSSPLSRSSAWAANKEDSLLNFKPASSREALRDSLLPSTPSPISASPSLSASATPLLTSFDSSSSSSSSSSSAQLSARTSLTSNRSSTRSINSSTTAEDESETHHHLASCGSNASAASSSSSGESLDNTAASGVSAPVSPSAHALKSMAPRLTYLINVSQILAGPTMKRCHQCRRHNPEANKACAYCQVKLYVASSKDRRSDNKKNRVYR